MYLEAGWIQVNLHMNSSVVTDAVKKGRDREENDCFYWWIVYSTTPHLRQ